MNAFAQTRDFIMGEYNLTEYEAWTIITTGVDFATTQLVDGNWGVHAVVPKALFVDDARVTCPAPEDTDTSASNMLSMVLSVVLGLISMLLI